jgi:hypothetical protein
MGLEDSVQTGFFLYEQLVTIQIEIRIRISEGMKDIGERKGFWKNN